MIPDILHLECSWEKKLFNKEERISMRVLENRFNWYKGNMHMHTTMSDGELDPVDAIGVYREAGYDFIAISDHRKVGHLWQNDNFLILPGVEWDTGDAIRMPIYHILGIGMNRETVDFYHGAPYEGAPLGNTHGGIWIDSKDEIPQKRRVLGEFRPEIL